MFAGFYSDHPTIHIPGVVAELSTRRVLTSELSDGARFAEFTGWPQAERDLAAETIYRFVFRSLYQARTFNGDPVSTQTVVEQMAIFYDTVREPGLRTITGGYATAVAGRFVDLRSPLAPYVRIPRSYVILQRINLGLFALLAELSATADWRAIAEEIWPFVNAPPSTPMGMAETAWQAQKTLIPGEQR